MNNDFDFIKDKFDNDNITAPDSINEFKIMEMLENTEPKRIKLYERRSFKATVSAVACLIIAFGVFAVARVATTPKLIEHNDSALSTFSSYDDIYSTVKKSVYKDRITLYGTNNKKDFDLTEDIAVDELATGAVDVKSDSFAETYKQVENVDEADIIKNDGRYIYAVDQENNIIKIYEGEKLISKIDDIERKNLSANAEENTTPIERIQNMYVKDNYLVAETYCDSVNRLLYSSITKIYIYDLTDITSPKLVNTFSQSGSEISSRMIGSQLYLVTNTFIYNCKKADDCIIYTGEGEEYTPVEPTNIGCIDNAVEPNYIIISSIDVENCRRTAQTKAIFGCGSELYCNENNMYILTYNEKGRVVVKATLSRDEIKFTDKADIGEGYVNNQFSMDEYNGYFRIATTDEKGNNILVFDDKLNKIGEIKGIAKDEEIKAVRFMGDIAYMITFENTDPLFVVDLSNPSEPKLLGNVEITGFSSQLVPVDENTILGIGEESITDKNGDFVSGTKLALFDVTDKTKPKVLDSVFFKDYYSQAQYNHKAIVVNKDKGYYAMAFSAFDDEGNRYGAMTFEIKDKKIVKTNEFVVDFKNDNFYTNRCTYINDTIYILDNEANIYSFKY